jgi:hypothetical protein
MPISATGRRSFSGSYGSFFTSVTLAAKLLATVTKLVPSGGDLATLSTPITVPAPGLFSTTMGWPSALATSVQTRRVTKSVVPPGGKGTTTRKGRVGQACACNAPGRAARAVATPAACNSRRRVGG